MITLDSPVETVLGDVKPAVRDAIVDKLGLATVGDLLRHFPRRYLETGTLTEVEDLKKGQLLTVVGEIQSSRVNEYKDRRTGRLAYRVDAVVRTDGPSLRLSFFAKNRGMAQWHLKRVPEGRRGIFLGQADVDRKSTRLNSSHANISYAVFCLKKTE